MFKVNRSIGKTVEDRESSCLIVLLSDYSQHDEEEFTLRVVPTWDGMINHF